MPGFNITGAGNELEPSPMPGNDIHRAHRWRISQLGDVSSRTVKLYAKSLTLPGFTVDEEVVDGASLKYKFAKMVNWEDVSIEFYDVFSVFESLRAWQDQVFTPATGIRPAGDYKKLSSFVLTDGAGEDIRPFTLHGSWPKQLSHSPLSYESSELKLVSLVLSYDFVTFDLA